MKDVLRLQFRKGSRTEAPLQRRPSQETRFGWFYLVVVPNGMKPRVRGELVGLDGECVWHGEDRDSARQATKDCQAHYETLRFRQDTMKAASGDEPVPEEKMTEKPLPFPPLEEAKIEMDVKPLLLDHSVDDPDLECLNKIVVIVNTTTTMNTEFRVVQVLDAVGGLLKERGLARSSEAIENFVKILREEDSKSQKLIRRRGTELITRVPEQSWRPSHVFKPLLMLSTDEQGNPCFRASYQAFGVNGDTPEGTMLNFDQSWFTSGPNQKIDKASY